MEEVSSRSTIWFSRSASCFGSPLGCWMMLTSRRGAPCPRPRSAGSSRTRRARGSPERAAHGDERVVERRVGEEEGSGVQCERDGCERSRPPVDLVVELDAGRRRRRRRCSSTWLFVSSSRGETRKPVPKPSGARRCARRRGRPRDPLGNPPRGSRPRSGRWPSTRSSTGTPSPMIARGRAGGDAAILARIASRSAGSTPRRSRRLASRSGVSAASGPPRSTRSRVRARSSGTLAKALRSLGDLVGELPWIHGPSRLTAVILPRRRARI